MVITDTLGCWQEAFGRPEYIAKSEIFEAALVFSLLAYYCEPSRLMVRKAGMSMEYVVQANSGQLFEVAVHGCFRESTLT